MPIKYSIIQEKTFNKNKLKPAKNQRFSLIFGGFYGIISYTNR